MSLSGPQGARDSIGALAFVTGATGGGIGSSIARSLGESGLRVAVNGRDPQRVAEAVRTLSDYGLDAVEACCDVADAVATRQTIQALVEDHGPVSVLVHNAAPSLPPTPIVELAHERWNEDLDTILGGAFATAQAIAPGMIALGEGRMVFISSSAAIRGSYGRSVAYAAAKAGLHGLVKGLALELGPSGITVNAVCPSQIDTPRVRRGGRRTDESLARYAEGVPLRRVGTSSDVSAVVSFLASPGAAYITGQVLVVDGGSGLSTAATTTQS